MPTTRKSSRKMRSTRKMRGGAAETLYSKKELNDSKAYAKRYQVIRTERVVELDTSNPAEVEKYIGNKKYIVYAL